MARITVEDCINFVPNRFKLAIFAGQRAKAIAAGAPITVPCNNDKCTVIALREIAEGKVDSDAILHNIVSTILNKNTMSGAITNSCNGFIHQQAMPHKQEVAKTVDSSKMIFMSENLDVAD